MRKHYPLNPNGDEDAGLLPWIDGVPETNTEGSYPGHALFTDMEAELLNLQGAAGLVQSSSDLTQVLQAVGRGGIYLGPLGGTANALAGTIQGSVVLPALQKGVRLIGYPSSANTSPTVTLAVTGIGTAGTTVTFPVNKPDGTPLVAGDIKIGRRYEFEADGAGNVLITGGGIGSGGTTVQQIYANVKQTKFSTWTTTTLPNHTQTPLLWTDSDTTDFQNNGSNGFKVLAPGVGFYFITLRFSTFSGMGSGTYPTVSDSYGVILKNSAIIGVDKRFLTSTSAGNWENDNFVIADPVPLAENDVVKFCGQVDATNYTNAYADGSAAGMVATFTRILRPQ